MSLKQTRQVLFLLPSLQGGGAERVIVTVLRHLERPRYQITLAVLDGDAAVYRGELPDDVEYIDLGCKRARYCIPALLRLIRTRRPDVVFSTIGHLNLSLALLKPFLPRGTRIVAREAMVISDAFQKIKGAAAWAVAFRRLYPRFDYVVCQSNAMRSELVEQFNVEPRKAVVIRNPVDVERARRLAAEGLPGDARFFCDGSSYPVKLVAAGRFVSEKGFDILLEALALLPESRFCLTLLGDGPMRAELEQLCDRLQLNARVQFAGFQSNPYAFYARASAFVLSSRAEGFPNVVLEAIACGAPVIATPAVGGIAELLEGRQGCVVSADVSAGSLSTAIRDFPFGMSAPSAQLQEYAAGTIAAQYAELLN